MQTWRKRILLISLIIFLSLHNVNAEESLFKTGLNDLKIACVDNDAYCDASVECRITITYPNQSIFINGDLMTYNAYFYNYTINTEIIGTYEYNLRCTDGTYSVVAAGIFDITPTGMAYTSAQGITYFILFIIVLIIFIFCAYGFLSLPFKNQRNNEDNITKIEWKKYLKIFCFGWAYVSFVVLIYLAWNISYAFLFNDSLSNFFRACFTILLGLALPVFIVGCTFTIIRFLHDKKFEKMLSQGLKIK